MGVTKITNLAMIKAKRWRDQRSTPTQLRSSPSLGRKLTLPTNRPHRPRTPQGARTKASLAACSTSSPVYKASKI